MHLLCAIETVRASGDGQLGPPVVRRQSRVLCRAHDCLRSRGGDTLLRVLLHHLLAQEEGSYAGVMLLERAHKPRRGDALQFCVPAVLQDGQPSAKGADRGDHHERG
jgi:hypothetical protein